MNIDELIKLKDGAIIRFNGVHDLLTTGKLYKVKKTNVGRMIINDKDFGLYLVDGDLYKMFILVQNK